MGTCYASETVLDYYPEPEENIMESIFKQYERVIVESLITSFGLDFLINDQHGGDVDTIHNVREIGNDPQMTYKNAQNQADYNNRGEYNSQEYHSNSAYIEKNREISKQRKSGNLTDSYTGEKIAPNQSSDLDHTISAKEIHDDKGRVLAGLSGVELANSDENLNATNRHTNRSKGADSMDDYLDKHGNEYTEAQKANMRKKDAVARKSYEAKLAKAYYTSPKFAKDVASAAGSVGVKMGIRQAVGFVFTEVWFSVKEEFAKINGSFNLGEFFRSIGNGVKNGFNNAKLKYRELLEKFKDGALAGALSSITTTICNIFLTTAKNVVKIIRETWASLTQAAKILFINPDNLPFGERMRAVVKILATGASIVVGSLVSEAIGKTAIGAIPIVGDIVQTFCGTLVTGILSCTLLYFFDRSKIMNNLVEFLNNSHSIDDDVEYFRRQALHFENYAAELMKIDIVKFHKETETFNTIAAQIDNVQNDNELNILLKNFITSVGGKIPWEGDFDSFMGNRNATLVFE